MLKHTCCVFSMLVKIHNTHKHFPYLTKDKLFFILLLAVWDSTVFETQKTSKHFYRSFYFNDPAYMTDADCFGPIPISLVWMEHDTLDLVEDRATRFRSWDFNPTIWALTLTKGKQTQPHWNFTNSNYCKFTGNSQMTHGDLKSYATGLILKLDWICPKTGNKEI